MRDVWNINIIYNKDKSKILLFNSEGRDFYMLPGGKIQELETSQEAIKREIKEETGIEIEKESEKAVFGKVGCSYGTSVSYMEIWCPKSCLC